MAVVQAMSKLKKLGVSTERPSDYFAEMVKTDDHMQKVHTKLWYNYSFNIWKDYKVWVVFEIDYVEHYQKNEPCFFIVQAN